MLRRHPLLALFTIGYLGVVGWVTLGPQPLDAAGNRALFRLLRFFGSHESTEWITYDRVQFIANIGMFVPIGLLFLLVLGRRRWWLAIAAGVLATVAIELAQRGIPGRVSDPNDVLANSLGTAIGVIAALVITTPAAIRDRRAAARTERARREADGTRGPHSPTDELLLRH
ncbi:VanZ family protein [Lacisediminihabitans changchengi]|uniref:VanZ family protein n=1 Tax=Lacisediminihabitans changchengi TaxID=2787634 RepID=A0A934SMA2_9MICO|nr:VanZ family protein [Lacisediminihabitans changchengi]MBK4347577.1 VanZ family protein [Lacisediminihabitans changchengi]